MPSLVERCLPGSAGQVRSRLPTLTFIISLGANNPGHSAWKLGVTSESQNNPVSTNGVNSAMTQSVRVLRKMKNDLKSGVKQQGL